MSCCTNFSRVTRVLLLPLRSSHLHFLFTPLSISTSPFFLSRFSFLFFFSNPPRSTGSASTYPGSTAGGFPQGWSPLLQAVWCWAGMDEPQPPPRVCSPSSNTTAGCQAKAVALIKHSASVEPLYTQNGKKNTNYLSYLQRLLTLIQTLVSWRHFWVWLRGKLPSNAKNASNDATASSRIYLSILSILQKLMLV